MEDSAVAEEAEDSERVGVGLWRVMPARGLARGSGEDVGVCCCSHLRTRERSEGWREGGRVFWKLRDEPNIKQEKSYLSRSQHSARRIRR